MKTKTLAFIVLISMIICGIGILRFLELHNRSVILRHSYQDRIPQLNSDRLISISKSTALALLAVGVIGALSVRRKKKNKRSPVQHNKPQTTSEDRDKAFIKLNKQYLVLQYKITQHKFSGDRPPDYLLNEISDLDRKIWFGACYVVQDFCCVSFCDGHSAHRWPQQPIVPGPCFLKLKRIGRY